MEKVKNFFGKIASGYSEKIWVKILVWGLAATLAIISVQQFVIRRYKRTVYKLRVSTKWLKAQRDQARYEKNIAVNKHKLALIKKTEAGRKEKRKQINKQIADLEKKSQRNKKKLSAELIKVEDKTIDNLLHSSKDLMEKTKIENIP